ncbi:S8 family serine peptidase [Thalassotalea nanhaiensis]|uniref:S8 family serine peptidase n=1 Tax=Thalassotalea nanhaiensis TaxID=3065648 RepID=A0ABY9TEY8_9GAMM|nr:S8 family serine peptidase [Colwelliaceae bacterium SQ345]
MKIKQLALATFSTLYMGSVAAAALTLPEIDNKISLPDISLSELPDTLKAARSFENYELTGSTESKFAEVNRINGMPMVNGVNQQLTQRVKFTPEDNIEGIQEYFVTLQDRPVAQYTGGLNGLDATHLRTVAQESVASDINSTGQEREVNLKQVKASRDYKNRVVKYKEYLAQQQEFFISEANNFGFNISAITQYDVAVNAFTTAMTQEQAIKLAELTAVKSIHRVESYSIQTLVDAKNEVAGAHDIINSHHFWDLGAKGEGIIVGVADTGINSDHPSFHDFGGNSTYTDDSNITWVTDDLYDHINPFGDGNYVGDCLKRGFEHMCNDKLIGVRSYNRITDQYSKTALIDKMFEKGLTANDLHQENGRLYAVPPVGEDHAGHGSHTAGTAAGNAIKDVKHLYREIDGPGVEASREPIGDISGVAPRANVIMYQVCISANSNSGYAGCLGDVMIEALEDAIEDGVDSLNWSLGGSPFNAWEHPIGQAFLSARESGMHIAVSAGNSGYAGTVKNSAPWILTVGATQTNRRESRTNAENMSTGADLNASIDGVDYPLTLSNRWFNISGDHFDGDAVLAEYMGACVEDDCTEGLVCKAGFEMLEDDLCYLECSEDEFRDPDTKQCDSFGNVDIGDQHDPSNCLIGTEWVSQEEAGSGRDWGCLDINRDVPKNYTTRESICLANDDAIFPTLTDIVSPNTGEPSPLEQKRAQRFYCPELEYDDVHPNYRGRLGNSKGIVCAYGVEPYMETEFNNGLTWNNKYTIVYHDGDTCKDSEEENCVPEDRDGDGENSTIDQPTLGQCRVRAPADRDYENYDARYGNSTGPGAVTNSFGVVSSRPVITDYKAPIYQSTTAEVSGQSSIQATANGQAPEMRVFEGDKYCENLEEWRDPNDITKPFNFDNAIVFCARGNGNNIDFQQKAENVVEVAKRDALKAGRGDTRADLNASIVVYNDDPTYGSLYNFPADIPFVNVRNESWLKDFSPFFSSIDPAAPLNTPSSLAELKRERKLSINSDFVEIVKAQEDSDNIDHTLANFTSKGPHYYVEDIMPVQVMAPGVHIYAAWSDNTVLDKGWNSADFAFSNGTSMATPVVAGSMALFKQLRPNWSESERESAMTMTASPVRYTTRYITEEYYDADNPDHRKISMLIPATDENGELIYEDGELVMIEQAIYQEVVNVNSWHVGTGLIDLKAAINTGLVLDETLENMLAASPNEGGDVRQLNMPYLFDGSCPETCTWLRTFKAKKAGTYNVNIDQFEAAVSIKSSVDSFTLAVGESVTVMFTAKIDRSVAQDQYENIINGTGYTGGEVSITANDPSIPELRLPVGVSLNSDYLPTLVEANVNADTGRSPIDLSRPAMSTDTLSARVYHQNNVQYIDQDSEGNLVKSSSGVVELDSSQGYGQTWIGRVELPIDQSRLSFDFATAHKEPSAKVLWVDVPEGTKMLAVDTLRKVETNANALPELQAHSGTLMMVVGRDIVAPGELNFLFEGTCVSQAEKLVNKCYVMDPQPGKYWILLQNTNDTESRAGEWILDTYDYAVSLVADQESSHIILDAPMTVNPAQDLLQMDLVYSVPMKENEASYAVAELFSNEHAIAADMGTVPIRLYRHANPIELEFSRDMASPGAYVRVDVDVAANHSGYNRPVEFTVNLPEGVSYVRGAISGDPRFVTGYEELENASGVKLSMYQPNTHRLGKGYIMSTNIDPEDPKNASHPYVLDNTHNYNPMCRTPAVGNYYDGSSSNGGYVDLVKLNPAYARTMTDEDTYFDLERLYSFGSYGFDMNLYGGPRSHTEFKVSPRGYISAGMGHRQETKFFGPNIWPQNEILIAPLMRKGVKYDQTVTLKGSRDLTIGESVNNVEGMTMSLFADGVEWKTLVEWDNVHSVNAGERLDDSMDFQAWFDLKNVNYPGAFEIIYAYDNLDMMAPDEGWGRQDTVGFQGLESDRWFFGLIKPPRREFFAHNNIEEVLHDDLVVCYDYYGPDYSASNFSFWLRVDDQSSGQELDIEIIKSVDADVQEATHTISVPSQITIGNFSKVIVEQGKSVTVPVYYADSNLTANTVNAYSDNLNVFVNGNEPGAQLTIDANCSFTGDTTVTIEVSDNNNETDVARKNIEVQVLASAGFSGSACSTVNDTDEEANAEEVVEAESDDGSSGGSFGLFLLMLACFSGFKFRKVNG